MSNGDMPANPVTEEMHDTWNAPVGLTKREHFAAMAMAECVGHKPPEDAAKIATDYADALLSELEKLQ